MARARLTATTGRGRHVHPATARQLGNGPRLFAPVAHPITPVGRRVAVLAIMPGVESENPTRAATWTVAARALTREENAMGKRGDAKSRKERARESERQRRAASSGDQSNPEQFGIRLPRATPPGGRPERPDMSAVDWDALQAAYPDGAHGARRAMFIANIGDRTKRAVDFMSWGLKPNPVHPESRFARDDAAVTLDDEPNLVSSTALYPTMNASENLVAAAHVISYAILKGQLRTSAATALCRIAMESSAKTIWLIRETDTDERLRRCYGFAKGEYGRQDEFERFSTEAFDARTDTLVDSERAEFERVKDRASARRAGINALPREALQPPPSGPLALVVESAQWIDEHVPRAPDPELDRVVHPRDAKSFYSLSSGFVHGFKWLTPYVTTGDDSGLLQITLDALGNALRMTECAVALYEAQAIGPRPDPRRRRNYPAGLAATVEELAPRYR